MAVVGYVRVSTEEQADSRAGLDAQRTAIEAEAARRGWQVVGIFEDAGISGKAIANRPALAAALAALGTGDADALMVAKLDRLSRSLLDLATLLAQSEREAWRLVALDLGIDTTTPQGEMLAHLMGTWAQFERRLISQRTRDALAQVKARGVRLGRPRMITQDVLGRISRDRAAGMTLQAIADSLTASGIPTAQGGAAWYPATVAAVLRSIALDAEYAAA
jgi:DNA invertase Pin-like site-specific DNA recombinase